MRLFALPLLTFLPFLSGCSSVSGLTRLDEFSDEEFERYVGRTAANLELLASASVEEGDLGADELGRIVGALRLIADEGAGLTALLGSIEVENGYERVGLLFTLNELEARLEARGAYEEGGLLGPRARRLISGIADALERVEPPPPEG